MSLNTAGLKQELKEVYAATLNTTGSNEAALDAFLSAFCDKLEAYIKSATIVYDNGLAAGTTSVIGTFNGRLE